MMHGSVAAGRVAHSPGVPLVRRAPRFLARLAAQAATTHVQLEEWIVSNGGNVTGVQLDGRRLVATQDLAPGACLVSCPPVCQLRYDAVTDSRLMQLFDRVPRGSDTQAAAWQFKQALTLLAAQSQGGSSNNPHLSLLPGTAPGVPVPRIGMLLPDQLLPELQYAPLIQDIMNHKYWWSAFYEQELLPLQQHSSSPFGHQHVTKEAFGDAVAVVISRCFKLSKAQTHSMPALIDMADHTVEGATIEVRSDDDGGVVNMFATTRIPAGAQLQLSYGPHTNADLLLSYGFVVPNNPNDRFVWAYDLEVLVNIIHAMLGQHWVQMPLPAWKHALLRSIGLDGGSCTGQQESPTQLHIGGTGNFPVDGRLLGALRVVVAQDDAQPLLEQLPRDMLCDWTRPVARQHEASVLKALISFITALYQSFPTTIQQDRALLPGVDAQLSMIITFRLSLKLALEFALKQVIARYKEFA